MPTLTAATSARARAAAAHRLLVVMVLGFASGLPLALTGQALQAWLSVEGIDIATIGFLSLVGLPYTFKFLWAPLMDRFELLPGRLGRRRGWLIATQLALALTLVWLASTPPKESLQAFALLAVAVAFVSASQDVVIDAYRTDLLPAHERGLGGPLAAERPVRQRGAVEVGQRALGEILGGHLAVVLARELGRLARLRGRQPRVDQLGDLLDQFR